MGRRGGGRAYSAPRVNWGAATVFKLTPNGFGHTRSSIVWAFLGGSDGAVPIGRRRSTMVRSTEPRTSVATYHQGAVFALTPKGSFYT